MPKPKPKRDEALVKFKAGGTCGTDLHFYRGEWADLPVGKIIGHGASGEVEETGERVVPSLARKAGRIALVGDFYGLMNLGNAEEATFFSVIVNPNKYPLGLDLLSKKINIKAMITHKFQLKEFEAAIETAADPRKKPVKPSLKTGLSRIERIADYL